MRYLLILLFSFSIVSVHADQGIPQIPQIPAFLPMAHTVPMGEATPIDGEWTINTIGKRIRIQRGRAYAVDPWLHMFVLKVNPMMVVLSDITTADGQNYVGKDLPLMGKWTATLGQDGMLNATVQTMVGPVRYGLMPVRIDDQDAYEQAKSGDSYTDDYDESGYEDEYDDDYEYEEDEEAYEDDEDYEDYDDYEDDDADGWE